jgi:hypothetical protein
MRLRLAPASWTSCVRQQQQDARQDLEHETREEVRQLRNVAVNPFDHLTWDMDVVERHVELEAVGRKIAAQPVSGGPADIGGHVRLEHADHLRNERQNDEQRRQLG